MAAGVSPSCPPVAALLQFYMKALGWSFGLFASFLLLRPGSWLQLLSGWAIW
jgi:hypothetical protein